ncbi:MAG: CDP-alcohol phosphatidyltransferase family protein [Planctomycetes bacterium]|nr:CDP-alcohol phosphatidyltransferase family protein [Planctomycetota bacterium]MCB9905818.1 CDP-alcohol phosphatidyltransferase family protein [Planctomycetota bacterium]
MKPISMLPNLLTLANAACGLLAINKGIDALAYSAQQPELFYRKLETSCGLIFLAMVFDALDGKVARLTRSFSDFGAQLDSFADAVTFGAAPALLAKILIEHEGPLVGYAGSPRLHFAAAATFTLMAILRLARFNLETEHEAEHHESFSGLPSPAAAGAIVSTIWVYMLLRSPELERAEGTPTPFGWVMDWMREVDWTPYLSWVPPLLALMLPIYGLLMVSRVPYAHAGAFLTRERGTFYTLVGVVFAGFLLYTAPVPVLFLLTNAFVLGGAVRFVLKRVRRDVPVEPAERRKAG